MKNSELVIIFSSKNLGELHRMGLNDFNRFEGSMGIHHRIPLFAKLPIILFGYLVAPSNISVFECVQGW
ncbi:uncharacterized protein CANTADRAFT_90165 [Suhomyces tanzawaensis NRRL Y-17324]|uniref:Uncharacterized protein n=1 Tax=Suhomyces tanzawaensis NRRL Y-17324 TaxID=984487 RepID=A0A1E4SHU6_9ASCO|nr:uncharacterized protein CANTADRAFT_90165 [Suhomyces tanzawaensis NRRL Y-17324]ODV79050.1 hypothetical protein CANTADRAFT_90165 [Suhomyces tanzawaensis NRRL Y-17324]